MQATTELSDAEIDAMGYSEVMVWAIMRENWALAREAARYADERALHVSRALQSLPAVLTVEDLWRAGFRSHALYPTGFRP
jgi:predicted ATPase